LTSRIALLAGAALALSGAAPPLAAQEPWPGSVALEGSATRFKVYGFAELDAVHDSAAITTPTAFVTSAIVTRNATPAQGSEGRTSFSVQPTRLGIESRTPLEGRRLTVRIETDFFGDYGADSASFRLRRGYGEVSDALFGGDLLFGQEWATFTNLDAVPNVLDYQTPNALFATRRAMVRWTKPIGSGIQVKLAAEAPNSRVIEGGNSVTRWPDGVLAAIWDNGAGTNMQASLLSRDLRASLPGGQTDAAWGAGVNVAGRLSFPGVLPARDFVSFSLTIGDGIGGVMNDTPPDAAVDPASGALKTVPTRGWYAAYQHGWSPTLYSVASYAVLAQSTLDFQPATAFRETRYASANLTWTPSAPWLLGVELLYGSREDKDGTRASVVRTQLVSRLSF